MLLSGLKEKKYEMPTKFLSNNGMTASKTGGSNFIVQASRSEPLTGNTNGVRHKPWGLVDTAAWSVR